MNDIKIFDNAEFGEIRTAGTSEKPLFCLTDICRVLDLHAGMTKQRLDSKGVSLIDTPTNGGIQSLIYINEKNLYKVIMRSDKPQAEPFQDWVCGEVLPSIRKTGSYSTQINSLVDEKMKAIEWTSKILNLNELSKLKMIKSVLEPLGLPAPEYVSSKGILKSVTVLLKENERSVSARAFNQLALANGYLKEIERKTSKGGTKKFKAITNKGLEFGEN